MLIELIKFSNEKIWWSERNLKTYVNFNLLDD